MNSICDLPIPQDAIPYQVGIGFALPWVEGTIPAGFPSPAADFLVKRQDLNDLIIQNPTATFFWQARGPSMIEAGIFDGDILVIDRSVSAVHGSIVVAEVDNDFTVKYLHRRGGLYVDVATCLDGERVLGFDAGPYHVDVFVSRQLPCCLRFGLGY
jgi:DNA polymerase V